MRQRFRYLLRRSIKKGHNSYAKERDKYRVAVKDAPKEGWATFCGKVEIGRNAASQERILSRNPEVILTTLRLPDGRYSISTEETLADLMEAHFLNFNKIGNEEEISQTGSQKSEVTV